MCVSECNVSVSVSVSVLILSPQSMKVRIAALQCLGAMTTLPPALLKPHAKKVVRTLAKTLDDPKRMVRKEAVKCRTEWFLVPS